MGKPQVSAVVELVTEPETVTAGNLILFSGKLTNTGDKSVRYDVTLNVKSDCDATVYPAGSGKLEVGAGAAIFFSIQWRAPVGACLGTYIATTEVEAQNKVIAAVETAFAVAGEA